MDIPAPVRQILQRLRDHGFPAYAVGGCVRDSLLGISPADWDLCTSALPAEVEACFPEKRVAETGRKHGTVTVVSQGRPYEITTFRREGSYPDHRRPERVEFVDSLEEDLARRDFTVNAMALGLDGKLHDPFGGRADLQKGILRAVGDPEKRFEEDALRILRGLRFAARLGFSIAKDTVRAMEEKKDLLAFVSGERVYKELTGLLTGPYAGRVLLEYGNILEAVLPEIGPAVGFLHHNPGHHLDVWQHTVAALERSQPDPRVRWALLLHDLGKPDCFTLDGSGRGHFYGHPARSGELAQNIFCRLRADRRTSDTVCLLVREHDRYGPASERTARRWTAKFGAETLRLLLEVKRCDCLAHADTPDARRRYENLTALTALIQKELESGACRSAKDLEVGGRDVLASGIPPGPEVGKILNGLLEDVLEGRCPNQREALLRRLEELGKG